MIQKKLVVFNSIGGDEHKMYATVNANTEDSVIAELTEAAISDANLFCDSEHASDSDSVTGTIRRMLEPLGFKFFDAEPFSTVNWDSSGWHNQNGSLLQARLKVDGIKFEVLKETGLILIGTNQGGIIVSPDTGKWQRIPTSNEQGTLAGTEYETLVELVGLYGQGGSIEWKSDIEPQVYNHGKAVEIFGTPSADGWRLPTREEWQVRAREQASTNHQGCPGVYWSSTADASNIGMAWSSYDVLTNCNHSLHVRLVRDVQR